MVGEITFPILHQDYSLKPLVVTPGEPAGIGPDIVLDIAVKHPELPLVIVADRDMLARRAKLLGLKIDLDNYKLCHIPLAVLEEPGKLNVANAVYVLECLRFATQGCLDGQFQGLVTGPVHKGIINEAGFAFSGHTEFLAELTGSPLPVMLMVTKTFKVALLTTHLPLVSIPAAVTEEKISQTVAIIAKDFKKYFQIEKPRIAVCGLNPHAGENGHIGREEVEIISPTVEKLKRQGYRVHGPISADTAFTPEALKRCDVVLAMYHDQALPVVKTVDFDTGVNMTLGLPILRTSVDHGTALHLAGSGQASSTSLASAMSLGLECSHQLKRDQTF